MPLDGKITHGPATRPITLGTNSAATRPASPEEDGPAVQDDSDLEARIERNHAAAERDRATRKKAGVLARREQAIGEYERALLSDQVTSDQVRDGRREDELEQGRAYFANELREVIERGGDRYALLAGLGPPGIEDLIERSNEHWERTGKAISIGRLLDDAEDEARAALQAANEGLLAGEQSPEAKKVRALKAIDAALAHTRAQEQNGWALRRGAVRRGAEAARRTRTRAAIERVREEENDE